MSEQKMLTLENLGKVNAIVARLKILEKGLRSLQKSRSPIVKLYTESAATGVQEQTWLNISASRIKIILEAEIEEAKRELESYHVDYDV